MTKHIQVRGERASGKTTVALGLAEHLSYPIEGFVAVVSPGGGSMMDAMARSDPAADLRYYGGIESFVRASAGIVFEYVVWDGVECPHTVHFTVNTEASHAVR